MRPIFAGALFLYLFSVPPNVGSFPRDKDRGKADKDDGIVECTISIDLGRSFVELRIVDQKLNRELVQNPIANARRDVDPAKYKVLGSISMKTKDGLQSHLALFDPWGRFSRDRKIYIADFNALGRHMKESLAHAIDMMPK